MDGQNKDKVQKFFGGATTKEIMGAFKRLDVNKNDSLTWAEFEAATKPAAPKAVNEAYGECSHIVCYGYAW